tara:strand:+ start:178 stop:672 length:495 start_codon:yes stop_codon:yes gene_type:complete
MKNIITKLAIVLTLLVGVSITNPAQAQQSRNSVGFVAGSTYGFGIGFKHQFYSSPVAVQVAGFPLVTENDVLLTGGLAFQFTLHRGNYGSTFISVASAIVHEGDRWTKGNDRTMITAGPGIGIEWMVHRNFGFVLDIPAAAIFDAREGFKSVLPIPNLTMMYTW